MTLCVQKANALTLLIQKADAVARVVRTTFALTLCVQKGNSLTLLVWRRMPWPLRPDALCHREVHQEKKSASGCPGCIRTHQALGTLWMHPGRAHTAPNTKRTGNVNSDTARHGTMHSDAVCQGVVRPDAACHGICLPDRACQGIFLLDAAMSGHFHSGRSRVREFSFWAQPCQGKWHPDDACHGITVTLSVKVRNIVANTLVAFENTQWVPGIVTQSSSIHSI